MTYVFSKHVVAELHRRKIPRELVEQVLQSPQQKVPEVENVTCYQSRVEMSGKEYLLRVMVNETTKPATVVTVYRTSKVAKYWRPS